MEKRVRAKKSLGQHFLRDESIAMRIVESLSRNGNVLEVGPGTGVLTKYLVKKQDINLKVIEIDRESVCYLKTNLPQLSDGLIEGDFLKIEADSVFEEPFSIIGNFPYNISSQIFFKILDNPDKVPMVVCMIQKEVAERLVSEAGKKAYGILSVFLQMWYDMEYLFTVEPHVFDPPPKVRSSVIRLTRNERVSLDCNPVLLKKIVKTSFNYRRKTLRNSLKSIITIPSDQSCEIEKYLPLRPEQLSVEDFIELTNALDKLLKHSDIE